MCYSLVQKCLAPVALAMKDSKLVADDISEIVLVGDFTRTPMIQRMIHELFPNKSVRGHDNTSHFKASHGASLEAAIVKGVTG